jgi:hypothetical protein
MTHGEALTMQVLYGLAKKAVARGEPMTDVVCSAFYSADHLLAAHSAEIELKAAIETENEEPHDPA